ncbi:uncharacterized protein K452DRAFT_97773 [Aplosporella prunicola CBS 121167]|uniref:Major facilitator superfamily (MFS) profile domain-containing protein n=1 Tax=Aplosporella prunicola CBS 121167 TaxID=1176127 RepID=A0A6A6B4P6_9PEZI|nr:uncharacterized protein K452DRAFT_97773 [Aplosporella prunicola CBS 121167]KAF2137721.1 hypothetical protein K452DRAFT_97773 [Aplosporella prunicola CBS 121167]
MPHTSRPRSPVDTVQHDYDGGEALTRRTSALEEAPSLAPPAGFPGISAPRRRSIASHASDDIPLEQLASLTRSASAISGHREAVNNAHELHDNVHDLPAIQRPRPAKPGNFNAIREVPSEFTTPLSTRPPSPVGGDTAAGAGAEASLEREQEHGIAQHYPDVGTLRSWRGALILVVTCGAQLMDNVFMTGVNIALPAIQRDLDVESIDLQWLLSAYTLTFGGFLLLSGVLADRFGRKLIFAVGMGMLSVWSLANGLASSFIQLTIFRAIQGIGAAMTIPSAVGIISNYFIAKDRTLALTIFGASGAVGFCLGLIFGGFLTASLGWRYIFYIAVAITAIVGIIGWFVLPKDRLEGSHRPQLDLLGAGLSTTGLILLSFVLSSGGVYGWGKAFIIALLVISVALLVSFAWVESKVSNPVMPLSLWKLRNFPALWIGGFAMYAAYQTVVYYTTLAAQDVNHLSAGQTALRFLPMGATGFTTGIIMAHTLGRVDLRALHLIGMGLCTIAPVPAALMRSGSDISFWPHVFPTSVLAVAGTTVAYNTITVFLLESVPVNAKSLCGGMVNTAFQIGSGVGLALASAVVQAVDGKAGPARQYGTGLWCCVGLAGVGLVSGLGVRKVKG